MTRTTSADLGYWRDPEELLEAFGRVDKDQREELGSAVAGLLDHPDADVRNEAFRQLFVSWKAREHRGRLVGALRSDAAPEVRATAAFGIAATASPTTRDADVELLIARLDDEREDVEVRRAAYEAILIVHRRSAFPSHHGDFDPRADVDWPWIQELRRHAR